MARFHVTVQYKCHIAVFKKEEVIGSTLYIVYVCSTTTVSCGAILKIIFLRLQ